MSCFRHACRWNLVDDLVQTKTGINPEKDGLSISDFYTGLRNENLKLPSWIDVHACAQTHPVWDVEFDRIITLNVDDTHINPGLNAIESEMGMGHTHFDRHPIFDALRESHYATDIVHTGSGPVEELRIRRRETGRFPKTQLETSVRVHEMVAELHGIDMGRVGSDDTQGMLFKPGAAEMKDDAA